MNTIIIIIGCCWILYKSGAVGRFLEKLKTKPDAPADPVETTTAPPDRRQLEADALYILQARGLDTNNIKYMSNNILNEIINDYITGR